MTSRVCLLVPVYNHKDAIRGTVTALAGYGIPIFVVDDGSDAATRDVLRQVGKEQPLVRLFRLPENSGKGAAVVHGLREAHRASFSHALQIDADGQHETRDVARFLERSAARPEAAICGRPIFDQSVPKARYYGRRLTNFWVRIETLSFSIGDALCGFRLYPLAETYALIESTRIATRMNFDLDIIVRLAWRGVAIDNLPTRITYPANGISHFDMLRDNVRISMTHTRLVFGMLARLPLLVWRKFRHRSGPLPHWSRLSERGSSFGMDILSACYHLLGDRVARLMLYPIVAWFFLTGHAARNASFDYLRRLSIFASQRTQLPAPTWRHSFRHMLAFAESGLDKLGAWMGRIDERQVEFPQQPDFERLLGSGRGAVVIGSHLGNLEMTRALAAQRRFRGINAVVYTEHARRFTEVLARSNEQYAVNLIHVSSLGPETAIAFSEKIERGEILVIVGDRTPPADNGRVTMADFLGSRAPFAQGPWILASLLDCPVYLFFCLREGNSYRIHFEHFADRIELPRYNREARLAEFVQRYARRLEARCIEAPYQWFNFFDFWDPNPPFATGMGGSP